MAQPQSTTILESARVLDLTDESGVFCAKLLAGFGADVIIVERPTGSSMRSLGPFYKDQVHPEKSLHWFIFNLNKRSITLNIETLDGQKLFKELVKKTDIMVESFPPGYLKGLGLAYEDLRAVNPGIVITSITPFGQTGPYSSFKGCDMIGQAMGGLMYQCGDVDTSPVQVSVPVAYTISSAQAAVGTLMAYYHKLMSGKGQHVDVSIQEGAMWAQKPYDVSFKAEGTIVSRGTDGPLVPGWPPWHIYFQCKDGWIASMPTYWSHRIHLREWLKDEGLGDKLYDKEYDGYFRGEGAFSPPPDTEELVISRFTQLGKRYDKNYLYKEGQRRGMQVTPVNTAKDLMQDKQLWARNYFIRIEHPELNDTIVYPGAPVKMSESPWCLDRKAPLLGEHNEEIYVKELGLKKEELTRLREMGII